ncbi:MAG TPA: tetratricopeptide repeat protein [Polyangiaceae bacterium]|nr:tetratricopeptide repeat protein [Polyangiaceae bacterium]
MSAKIAFPFLVALGIALVAPLSSAAESETKAKVADTLSKECVGPDTYKALEACPGGPDKFDIHQKRGAAFKSAPPPVEKKERKDDLKPTNPDVSQTAGIRDERTTRLKARARALLITEITGLERLYGSTRKKSPDRPQLVRRLAEGYVELETAANHDKTQAEIDADDAKRKKDKSKYDRSRGEAGKAKKILDSARQNAIKFYNVMKKDYPNYSKLDEVLYYLAYEYEQAGDLDNARKVYYELIQKAPKSKYIPNAYLAFGELFFQEAMGDPSKWALAGEAYKQVLKYPPPENKVWGYAHYKLGYVYWNTGDYAKAIQEFKETIEYGDKYSDQPNSAQLQKAARKDLIPVYAISGKPDKAYNFFKPLSGDKSGDEKTIDMMNDLGTSYLDTGHYEDAIVLYHELMSRDKGDKYCSYQTHVSQATQAMKASDKGTVIKEFDNQLRVRKEFNAQNHSQKAKDQCSNDTAELLAETGMSWHLEAVGTGGVRGTGSQDTMDKAAILYRKVVDNFKADEFAKFQFPRIVKEDWPTLFKIKYAMADLLYFQQKWDQCGPAFDMVVEEDPKGPQAPEAAYASVLCYQKMYDAMHKGNDAKKGIGMGPKGADAKDREAKKDADKFKPKPFTDMQKGMIQAFNRYVCYIKPPENDKEAQTQYVEVKYARARTYFEAQHWEEAAVAFRDVAIKNSDSDAAGYAANLYLESLNVLGAHSDPPRPTCFDDMANDVPVFLELYCQGSKAADNKEQCDLLNRIQCDIRRLRAQKIVELADSMADKGQDGALDKYKEGGDAYMELWRTYGEEQLQKGEASQCGKMDEILYNGAQAYQAARLLAKSINVRRLLLDPRFKLNDSDLAKKSIYQIGRNYQAIAVYDVAASYFEKYAEATKYTGENADQAINDAVVLRLGLGQADEAIEDAQNFNKYYGAKKPELTAQIAFAIADHYAQKEDWENARKRLQGGPMNLIDKKASADVQIQAHALLARVLMKLNQPTPARSEYGKVVGLWKDPQKAVGAIQGMPGEDDAGKQRRIGKALTAVGEAMFFFAEEKRAKVDKIVFPEYKGPGTLEEVKKHIQTKVKDWIGKKKPAIDEATAEYKKIVDLQPVPPPQWVIAAGSRVGSMWGQFVKEFRAAPIPDKIRKDVELRQAYYASLDEASEPQKQTARGAFKTCLDYSVTYQYFDEFSRTCEEWLAQNYKSEFHLIDEFRGAPTRVNSTLKERAYPLQVTGEPYIIAAQQKAERPVKKEDDKETSKEKKK